MERRSRRSRRIPAPEYLMGYVEDDEPVEEIMKKFKQLEDYQEDVGRTDLTAEDCNNLFNTTTFGSIANSFRPRYHIVDQSPSPSSSEGEATRPHKYVDPVTQSYQQVHTEEGGGRVVRENVFQLSLRDSFQAVLVDAPPQLSLRTKQKFKFLKHLVQHGLLFVWTCKKEIKEWVEVLEKFKFQYIENLVWVKVDESRVNTAGGLASLSDFTPDFFMQEKCWPIPTSHMTLLMFRKLPAEKLELRHQRTCDVVFDFKKPKNYVYHMIETLLPEAGVKLELFADDTDSRQGWIHVVHQEPLS